ncbi:Inner membrane protein YqjA [Candidatus Xiphinematobacter sp. Idaho Grape]|uniref:VTT domain-containing protein n=1 Tax=Candidatus Xiphinematobacter sp. Idaho Grape TaxID=1704307 RepID=UPI000706A17E|nr:VTT domain-containing protein [Candidatus Xiphinematobacter sp. Idaho Grape]ALJ56637.1 Inner membrane protein YqjA [Candidatus Xiphinematobacter sp. Idaho Grape]
MEAAISYIYSIVEHLLKIDYYLEHLRSHYGFWTYAFLFSIVFFETGLIITPFLPGDVLLFTVGTLAARNYFSVRLCIALLTIAAFIGGAVNYSVGKQFGMSFFRRGATSPRGKYLWSATTFFAKHGGKAVVISRFLPILRTMVPFVAGMGKMHYQRFLLFNAAGAIAWVTSTILAGWIFGNIPLVRKNFEIVVIGIFTLSTIPLAWKALPRWHRLCSFPQKPPSKTRSVKSVAQNSKK